MKSSSILLVSGLALALNSTPAQAEHTRVTNPNALSVELLGRGLAYSLSYDRVMDDHLAAGFGFGTVSTQLTGGADAGKSAVMIPAYVNFYLMKEQGSPFATAGATLLTNSGSVQNLEAKTSGLDFNSSAVLPTFGVGYENRGDAGFLFRVAAYGIVAKSLSPWFGFTFGYAF